MVMMAVAGQEQPRVASYLQRLRDEPPNVLLLEGGTLGAREGLAQYWAALLNCRKGSPCGECTACGQISDGSHRDLYFLSGVQETIKVEDVRPLRGIMADKPQGEYRVMILSQAQEMSNAAGNALLKAMEEPLPGNAFVLLCPQRHLLLPTLLSRSFPFTLSWAAEGGEPALEETARQWLEAILGFWRSGRGLFEWSGRKKSLDRQALQNILLALQQELFYVFLGREEASLARFLRHNLEPVYWSRLDLALKKAEELLAQQVNPALILEWLALQVWRWLRLSRSGAGNARSLPSNS